ncbi:MAG: helix-turn-helix domain-containing protein [Acidobacteria bacterium]|nr:helix-turn-helix domain-containing protein [Acidobacteriota bacterium]MBA3641293.1 helix-turn-helix domain-containing protein [Acidobacteriota bacterium]
MRITRQTAGRWRRRFVEKRLDGVVDEPRPGGPRRIIDAQVEQVIIDTLKTTPRDATHWSTRTLAKELARSACSRIGARRSSCRATRCSSTKCAMSWVSVWRRRIAPWS